MLLKDEKFIVICNMMVFLTCNGTADLAPTGTNTGAVPNHAVSWSFICFAHRVCLAIVLIIAGLFN